MRWGLFSGGGLGINAAGCSEKVTDCQGTVCVDLIGLDGLLKKSQLK